MHYWDTEEEAFQEYKLFKESEIRILAVRYRDKTPERLFDLEFPQTVIKK